MKFHGVYKINDDPCVISLWGFDAMERILELASPKQKEIFFIWHSAWYAGRMKSMLKLKYKFWQLKQKGIVPLYSTNSDLEDKLRLRFGMQGLQCISYIFTEERAYHISEAEPIYDAVYTAQLAPFKRIELAKDIDRLYIITYKRGADTWDLHQDYPELKHAEFNSTWIDVNEKQKKLGQSAVGICLSKEEGPMLASLEYQISGLPVVSTKSLGGRDTYYDQDHCLIVEDKPDAIRRGVKEMTDRKLRRQEIRHRTLKKMEADRERYVEFISDYLKKRKDISIDPVQLKNGLFANPTAHFVPLEDLGTLLTGSVGEVNRQNKP